MSWTLEQIKVYYRLRIHYTEVSEGLGKQQLMLIRRTRASRIQHCMF